jgi:CO/xanthine dehydrogenase FAD-binding subunit
MLPFAYHRPECLTDVVGLLSSLPGGARLLAGGTDLTVGLRHGSTQAKDVIDLKRVADLDGDIAVSATEIRVGATVTMTRLVEHAQVARVFPALAEAAVVVGSRQIRNRATLAGNICNASPAADTVPVLALHDASVHLLGPEGARVVPVVAFVQGNRRIDLRPGELVTAVVLPIPQGPQGAAFDRITRRRGVDLATVNLCCRIDAAGRLRLAFGAAAPRPIVVDDAADMVGRAGTPAGQAAALEALLGVATPISDVRATAAYRMAMLRVLAERTVARARERLLQGGQHG